MHDTANKHTTPTTWTVEVSVGEHDGLTRATARLLWRDEELVGAGTARLDPRDRDVAEIGSELAVGRAVCDLGRKVLVCSADAIEKVTGRHANVRR